MTQDTTTTTVPALLTTAQAAHRLSIPAPTLRYWRHRGEGPPAVKLGNLVRYNPEQLEAWIAERTETT